MSLALPSVLLVDDDQELDQMLTEYLSGEGFAVSVATAGPEALERLAATDFDLAMVTEETELGQFLEELTAGAGLEATAQGKAVVLSAIPAITISIDPTLLHRAVDNVLRNAVRFTPPGTSVVLSVKEENSCLEIMVRDHGPGVAPQHLSRIFEAFYRVEESRERTSGGAGLGLAITTRVLALHGGSAEARNAADGGLEVILRLPNANRAAQTARAPAGSPIREAPALSFAPET